MQTENVYTPFADLEVDFDDNKIILARWSTKKTAKSKKYHHPILANLSTQISKYSKEPKFSFSYRFPENGTIFQKNVWKLISQIPAGSTLTYSDIADHLNSSPRAVGNACRDNPLPLLIPCHRVVGKNSHGGFMGHKAGDELNLKMSLLLHESAIN